MRVFSSSNKKIVTASKRYANLIILTLNILAKSDNINTSISLNKDSNTLVY